MFKDQETTLLLNVSGSSSTPISACGSITTDSILTTDVTAIGTCMDISADDIELDCDGFTIRYDSSGVNNRYGVNISGRSHKPDSIA